MLQTAASIENLAVATYGTALTLDFIGGASANPVVKAFVMKTKDQHQEHAEAFNAAVTRLGGKAQDQPDPVLLGVVNHAKPTLTGPAPGRRPRPRARERRGRRPTWPTPARTRHKNARTVPASIMGVEAQHVAVLHAVKALVAGGAADLIALPPDAAQAARRRRQRRLPELVLQDRRGPPAQTKEQSSERRNRDGADRRSAKPSSRDSPRDSRTRTTRRCPSMRESLAEWARAPTTTSRGGITQPRVGARPADGRFLARWRRGARRRRARRRAARRARSGSPPAPRTAAAAGSRLGGRSSPAISRSSRSPPRSRTSPSRTYQAGIDAATAGQARRRAARGRDVRPDRAEPAQGPRRGVERRAHRRGQEGGHRRRPHGQDSRRPGVRPGEGRPRSGQARARSSRTSPRRPTSRRSTS